MTRVGTGFRTEVSLASQNTELQVSFATLTASASGPSSNLPQPELRTTAVHGKEPAETQKIL